MVRLSAVGVESNPAGTGQGATTAGARGETTGTGRRDA